MYTNVDPVDNCACFKDRLRFLYDSTIYNQSEIFSEWAMNFCLEAEMIDLCRKTLQNFTKNFKETTFLDRVYFSPG